MIHVAISNSNGNYQFGHETGPLVLADIAGGKSWEVHGNANLSSCQQTVEICQHLDKVVIQYHKTSDKASCGERVQFTLSLPAMFEIGDTQFAVSDISQPNVSRLSLFDRGKESIAVEASEREVTVLFADLRNFSSICAELETADSYRLLNEIMDCLTSAVMDHAGLVIDYYGDGLSAMWNAPQSQESHPLLACRAALQMLEELPKVNQLWRQRLPRDLRLGIGIHTGLAQVGNIGSQRCIKYGPRGTTVNLASRVEAATKKIRVPLLVTGAVATRICGLPAPPELIAYRTCQAQLPGIPDSVDLYAVARPVTAEQTLEDLERYETALRFFELGNLTAAENHLDDTAAQDGVPIRFLAEHVHAIQCQQLGRRESDQSATKPGAVIPLDVK